MVRLVEVSREPDQGIPCRQELDLRSSDDPDPAVTIDAAEPRFGARASGLHSGPAVQRGKGRRLRGIEGAADVDMKRNASRDVAARAEFVVLFQPIANDPARRCGDASRHERDGGDLAPKNGIAHESSR